MNVAELREALRSPKRTIDFATVDRLLDALDEMQRERDEALLSLGYYSDEARQEARDAVDDMKAARRIAEARAEKAERERDEARVALGDRAIEIAGSGAFVAEYRATRARAEKAEHERDEAVRELAKERTRAEAFERERDEASTRAAGWVRTLCEWQDEARGAFSERGEGETVPALIRALRARAEAAESALATQKEETARAIADAAVMREAIGHVGEWDSLTFNAVGVAKLRAALATNAGAGLIERLKLAEANAPDIWDAAVKEQAKRRALEAEVERLRAAAQVALAACQKNIARAAFKDEAVLADAITALRAALADTEGER